MRLPKMADLPARRRVLAMSASALALAASAPSQRLTGPPPAPGRGGAGAGPAGRRLAVQVAPAPAQIAPGALPGFASPAARTFANRYWTRAPAKYLAAADYRRLVARTAAVSRDQEAEVWCRNGLTLLRLAEGKAIFFHHNLEVGALDVGIVVGFKEGAGFRDTPGAGDFVVLRRVALGPGVPGYKGARALTDGDVFTFGARGFDIYARFNGVEFLRFKDFRCVRAGAVAFQANDGYGFRTLSVALLADAPLHSDPAGGVIDLRDFGLKPLVASGAIAAGSNRLALSSNPGFAPGDQLIVEAGGEAGRGSRGSLGVGGAWPALSYAGLAEMRADLRQAPDTYAWRRDSGDVHQFAGGSWVRVPEARYYLAKAVPRALAARVVRVSGDVLTLDRPAAATARGARVHADNAPIFERLSGRGAELARITPQGMTMRLPPGAYALSDGVAIEGARAGWILEGARGSSRLFTPRGVFLKTPALVTVAASRCQVRNLVLQGNARDEGFGLNVTETSVPQGRAYPGGLLFAGVEGGVASDLVIEDVFQKAVGVEHGKEVWARRCLNRMTDGLQDYIQWQFQWADSSGGGAEDCKVESPTLIPGFETFRSAGVVFRRPVSVNASFSCNSSGGWLIEAPTVTIGPGVRRGAFSPQNPIFNINANIDKTGDLLRLGGKLVDPTVVCERYVDEANDQLRCIVINRECVGVTVSGGYPHDPKRGGLIDYRSNWAPPSPLPGPQAVNATAPGVVVEGLRVKGATVDARAGNENIYCPLGSVSRCVADRILAAGGSGNVTNVEYGP